METKAFILPCGTSATVRAFDGNTQLILNPEDKEAAQRKDRLDQILRNVVVELGGRRGTALAENHLLALPSGSRSALLIASRRLTYGDAVKVSATCLACMAKGHEVECERDVDLAMVLDDCPGYPQGLIPHEHTASDGKRYAIGWGDGRTERAHLQARARKQVGSADEVLFRIATVDGEAEGYLSLVKRPVPLLDELRRVGRRMVPALWIEGEEPGQSDVPHAGPRTRIQLPCERCGGRQFADLEGQPDFLFRSLMASALD